MSRRSSNSLDVNARPLLEPTPEEQREYSVQRWAWVFVPQMATLGGVIGTGVWFAALLKWNDRFEDMQIAVKLASMLAFMTIGALIFGIIAERVSRRDRHWKAGSPK